MVIDDFHIVRIALMPVKASPPLVIDPDAELLGTSGDAILNS
jgi:hypothetical protein